MSEAYAAMALSTPSKSDRPDLRKACRKCDGTDCSADMLLALQNHKMNRIREKLDAL